MGERDGGGGALHVKSLSLSLVQTSSLVTLLDVKSLTQSWKQFWVT